MVFFLTLPEPNSSSLCKYDQRNPCSKVPFLRCRFRGKILGLFQESDVLDATETVLVAKKLNFPSVEMQ
jgi:hypothetical protein